MLDARARLTLDIVRHGWTKGHVVHARRRRLQRIALGARRALAILLLAGGVSLMAWAVIGCEKDCRHIPEAVADVEPSQRCEAHAAREALGVVHGVNSGRPAAASDTMKCAAFQGVA